MLKTIAIDRLKPNPFRRLDEYPIIREKVDLLKESIAQTGFWGTIVGRERGADVEIAFGHHRLVALREAKEKTVALIVLDLSNEQMLQMMARENMEEWGTSAWVELETIRATIEAYSKGEIKLPKPGERGPRTETSQGSGKFYNQSTVASFLGWTRKHKGSKGTVQPNYACETAFKAIEMLDKGFLEESYLKGLKRSQLADVVAGQWSIFRAAETLAEQNKQDAEIARQKAATAPATERKRYETQAKVYAEQEAQYRSAAKEKTKAFGKDAAELYRSDAGKDKVKARAAELRPSEVAPQKIHEFDDIARKLAVKLEKIANRDHDDEIYRYFDALKDNGGDLSPRAMEGIRESVKQLVVRLNKHLDALTINPRSHNAGTRNGHVQEKLALE